MSRDLGPANATAHGHWPPPRRFQITPAGRRLVVDFIKANARYPNGNDPAAWCEYAEQLAEEDFGRWHQAVLEIELHPAASKSRFAVILRLPREVFTERAGST